MKKILLITIFAILFPTISFAQQSPQIFERAKITNIQEIIEPDATLTQRITASVTHGENRNESVTVEHNIDLQYQSHLSFENGDTIVITRLAPTTDPLGNELPERIFIAEPYRLPAIAWITAFFLAIVIGIGRSKGLRSILGLALTVFVLVKIIVPLILQGYNPLIIMILGALGIAISTMYIAHGFTTRTTIALTSVLITFIIATSASFFAVHFAQMFGFGSETAFFLQTDLPANFDFRGLLLGGILIGALGVLDDITTGQSAAVHEIHKANPTLNKKELFKRGISVGREHIAALVNTLVLAYAGVSFPILLFLSLYDHQPLWFTLNSELFAEEIIRTLIGSSALIIAVPITTALAAYWFTKNHKKTTIKEKI